MRNWAGNVTFSAHSIAEPASLDELRQVVRRGAPVHALGSGHSFSEVADTSGVLVSLRRLPGSVEVDEATGEATVPAGMTLTELCGALWRRGRALPALPSLLGVTVAGAVATATHGSGDEATVLSGFVSALEWVGPDGELHAAEVPATSGAVGASGEIGEQALGEEPESLGLVVGLGAFGIVTSIRLRTEPAYLVAQTVYEGLSEAEVVGGLDEILASASSVSVFTRWRADGSMTLWRKRRVHGGGHSSDLAWRWQGHQADGPRHPIPGLPADRCTTQLGEPGPWHERLPHFLPSAVPSVGAEVQSEYFVDRTVACRAAEALLSLGSSTHSALDGVVAISEVRSVRADGLWLSPAYGRPSVSFHFTWFPDADKIRRAVDAVEEVLVPLGARPHWGKVFHLDAGTLKVAFPRLLDAASLRAKLDPNEVFQNELSRRYLSS